MPARRDHPHGNKKQLARLSAQKKKKFLDALALGHTVSKAAEIAGLTRQRFQQLKEKNPEFAAAWADAYERGADVFREEVRERALKGTKQAIVYQGKVVGAVRYMSDNMLMFATKARAPEYKDNAKIEVNVGDRLKELNEAILSPLPDEDDNQASQKGSEKDPGLA